MARLGFALLFALAGCASAEKPQVVAKPAVVVPAAATAAAKPVVAATTGKKDAFPTDWMKPGNIMKYDVDTDPMANRIAAQKTDTEEARTFNLKHVDLVSKRVSLKEAKPEPKAEAKPKAEIPKVEAKPAPVKPAEKPVAAVATPLAATTMKKEHDGFPTDWMKAGNIMKYDVDADPMAKRIESQKTDTEEARSFNLKHVDLLRLKAPVKKVENKTAVVAVVAAKPAEKQTKPQAKKDAFPTDWMKSGNIMKYDVDADPMSSRIENQQTDVQEAHTYNLKHVDLVQKKAPVVKAAAPVVKAAAAAEKAPVVKAAAPVVKAAAAAEKAPVVKAAAPVVMAAAAAEKVSDDDNDAFPSDWMSSNNVIKYDVDADPMAKRIESFEADVQQARTFNNKHVSLLQKKAPARNANEFLYVQDLA